MTLFDVSTGTLIDGRYKVLSRIGTGGMADVFLAEDQQLGRKVALKLLHRRFSEDRAFVERFRREAQAAAGLQHPNVVSVYDRGSFDDTYYIAMEYLPGASLKELVRGGAPMDPVRAIDITLQILKAARFAHRRGVIHRDLKPHNVIVDDSGHAKVTDFGIARAGASDITETGSIMGTAHYLSPEQAQGRPVTPASDLYSIGVVLYELITGRVPFDGDSAVTIALKHVSEAPTPPHRLNPAVPLPLEQVVLWTLNKDPADRPQDADMLIAALEQVREQIVSGGAVGEGTQSLPVIPGYVEAPPPPGDEHGRRWWPWVLAVVLILLIAGGAAAAYLLTRPKHVVVPPVTGETLNLARTQLQNVGFGVAVLQVNSSQPAGIVIGQSPQGGAKAKESSTVTLTVSQGPGPTTVPPVVGLSVKQARVMLRKSQLRVARVVAQPSDSVPSGQVTGTSPAAGATPPAGTGVVIFVSSGKPLVTVPDVTGQQQADAKSTLEKAGFAVSTTTQTSSTDPAGTVISQDPSGNTQARSGSAVAIVVAQAPTTAKVPDVTGDTAKAAQSALTGAGFTVTQTTKTVTKPNQDGIVISQSPAAGQTVPKGSSVAIVIGSYQQPTTTGTTTTSTTTTSTTSQTTANTTAST